VRAGGRPAQRSVDRIRQGAQQLLAVLVSGDGRIPHPGRGHPRGKNRGALGAGEGPGGGRPGGGPARPR
jgi:hypothetical protein